MTLNLVIDILATIIDFTMNYLSNLQPNGYLATYIKIISVRYPAKDVNFILFIKKIIT